ncbi:MAG: radical SAM protein [Dehalococcoidales bacterium]|nr:radical SAM protein [Dehalococcoidales bacterium]
MTSVLLIYPYFLPRHDKSIFRFPPLGLGYLAASLRNAGYHVDILDCTFMDRKSAVEKALRINADVVGIYSMVTMREDSLALAGILRNKGKLIIAGGPLPSCDPAPFTDYFDVVVRGEGEETILEVLDGFRQNRDLGLIPGIAYRSGSNGQAGEHESRVILTPQRQMQANLDTIAFPARDLFPNEKYIDYWRKRSGNAGTTLITTRGCPFNCEFCSNAVFGVSYRERSPENVVDEVEQALSLGYDYIHFADDVFTLSRDRLSRICAEIKTRGLQFKWECLGRVDSIDADIAKEMREAGCERIFFGIESADNSILRLMNKKITVERARKAIEAAGSAGIRTGAFFILCYPGETNNTVLRTIRFATALPLDYLSFTLPYPLPGTALFERVEGSIAREWRSRGGFLTEHTLTFDGDFSEAKTKFAIVKAKSQFLLRKRLGRYSPILSKPMELLTDAIFRLMR